MVECTLFGVPQCTVVESPTKEDCLLCILGTLDSLRAEIVQLLLTVKVPLITARNLIKRFDLMYEVAEKVFPRWAEKYDRKMFDLMRESMAKAKEEQKQKEGIVKRLFSGEGKDVYRT